MLCCHYWAPKAEYGGLAIQQTEQSHQIFQNDCFCVFQFQFCDDIDGSSKRENIYSFCVQGKGGKKVNTSLYISLHSCVNHIAAQKSAVQLLVYILVLKLDFLLDDFVQTIFNHLINQLKLIILSFMWLTKEKS